MESNKNFEDINKTDLNHKSRFYRKMVVVAIPVIAQNLIGIGLNMIDTLMIGRLGEAELAAVGSANQVFFLFGMVCFGFYSGASVYVAQFWGIKDIKTIRKVIGIDYLVGFGLAFTTFLIAFFIPEKIIWLFSRDTEVIGFGVEYLKIVCFSYIFTAISYAIVYNSRAIQRQIAATIINAVAICINTFLNYCLIYGNFGMPKLGVSGAAYATLIARIIELTMLITYVATQKEHPFHAKLSEVFSFGKDLFIKVIKTAIPVVFTEGGWAFCTSITFIAYGMLGPSALAVIQAAGVITDLSQSVFFGVGNATAVIIGETLGRGDMETSYKYGNMSMKIVWGLSLVVTLGLLLLSKPITYLFAFSPDTSKLMYYVLIAWAFTTTPKMLSYNLIVGILRAGGDTLYSLIVDLSCNVFIQLSLAFFSVLVLKLPLYWVVLIVSMSELFKVIFCYLRFHKKKWMNVVT